MYVKNISFNYPKAKTNVLEQVSFDLHPEKLNVVAGLNGAGKTTLFDCMTGVLPIQNGEMNLPPLSSMLYLTQSIYFSATIKGKDFAKFTVRLNGYRASDDVSTYVRDMDAREQELFVRLWDSRVGKMSVGERKWFFAVMLTRIERELYIFDELTSGVDPSSRIKILNRIQQLIDHKKICILSTHQLQELLYIDCHFIMLHRGKVVYEGDFKEWLSQNQTDNPDVAFEKTVMDDKQS